MGLNCTKHLKKNEHQSFLNFQKIDEGTLSNTFYEASITLIPKPDKGIKRKAQSNISDEYRALETEPTNFQNHDQVGFNPKCNLELRF